MTELIGTVSLQEHTLLALTNRNTSIGPDPLLLSYECLEHMNVFVAIEEFFIISSQIFKYENATDNVTG